MPRVLIIATYASIRAGLHALLNDAPDLVVAGEVTGSGDYVGAQEEVNAEVVLADVTETEAVRLLTLMDGENVALVLLGESENEARLLIGSDLPGIAYLKKEAEQEEIVAAVRSAAAGLVTLDRSFLASLRETISGNLGDAENRFALRYKDPLPPGETLTQREEQVLQLMAQGLPNKQIAAKLTISQHTVKFHVASILAKLNAVSRTEAVTIGARRGLILL